MASAKDELDTPLIVVIGILFAILTFVIIVVLQSWFYKVQADENYKKVVAPRTEAFSSQIAEQRADLHSYGWVDQKQGIVRIPVERAIELLVQEHARPAPRR
jgi:hypothetical protein